jgi:predicted SAM-dependent methyltransferase
MLKECYRVLDKKGFIRIIVPDADLRPESEILGFPGDHYSYANPRKHKTRWSIYSLKPVMEIAGFRIIPIKYYNRNGKLNDELMNLPLGKHKSCVDKEMVNTISHIRRTNSLILDGIK